MSLSLTPNPTAVAAAADQAQPAAQEQAQQEAPGLAYTIQCRLTVGAPDDPMEREADDMADRVMRMPETAVQRKCSDCEEETVQRKPLASFVQRKCAHCEEEETVQRKTVTPFIQRSATGSDAVAGASVDAGIAATRGNGAAIDSGTRSFMEDRFGSDFSGVKIHTGSDAVQLSGALGAQAFTVGNDIYFNEGKYNPAAADGRHLLAHELTHTLQQGATPALVQRRRVPDAASLNSGLPTTSSVSSVQAEIGMARVLSRAWAGLTPAQQSAVQTATAGLGLTWSDEESLRMALIPVNRAVLISFAQAIRTAAPSATLGDPLLINTGPRPATADAANIATLVANATAIFTTLAGNSRNADLRQVFGAANVAAAKTKYNNARLQMNVLHAANQIVTDRSGYNAEVSLGGLTNSSQISVSPDVIDNPGDNESVITFVHECMHAGNADVRDFGYIHQASFRELSAAVKLTNAAHFEVVPRRMLGASFAFTGQTFIPAGTTVGGTTAPPLTNRQQAIRDASEHFRQAWTIGLNLHNLYVRLFRTPAEWNTLDLSTQFGGAAAGSHFSDTLPFWSNVQGLTLHQRLAEINPSGVNAATRPVSLIDIALSEGMIRKLAQGMDAVPTSEIDAVLLETTYGTVAEQAAATASVAAERDLLIRLVIRARLGGGIAGNEHRDEQLVARMGSTANLWSDILAVRPVSAFP
ncbi:DUF4157 domain-containing protein [Taibaiella chishuiensis]|uniref:Uncharacterized protein DUF4157 n=1 Tax=Taibaiella chishuiensis TaxID=1434707 RepID=A0A2P8D865_9BACT|nr:DUF4157 domain-containing protein [Taibaiella chishuiensis]PSK93425.1 uncharacterized protein DUF4157 [Taibaiella chishuiensis]